MFHPAIPIINHSLRVLPLGLLAWTTHLGWIIVKHSFVCVSAIQDLASINSTSPARTSLTLHVLTRTIYSTSGKVILCIQPFSFTSCLLDTIPPLLNRRQLTSTKLEMLGSGDTKRISVIKCLSVCGGSELLRCHCQPMLNATGATKMLFEMEKPPQCILTCTL